jgi:lipopolysaccharide export LptBFGC system permease protein LptF
LLCITISALYLRGIKNNLTIGDADSDKDFTKEESQGMMDLLYSDNPKDVAEFQWRLSQPLSIFIFCLSSFCVFCA